MNNEQETTMYYKSNFSNKFKTVRDYRYKKLPERTRNNKFRSDYKQKFGFDIEYAMKNWFRKKNPSLPDAPMLKNICTILDCDIDYFLTEQNDFRKNARSVSDYLGLSYDTIERISNYSDKIKSLIDVIVFDNYNNHSEEYMRNADLFLELLEAIYEYATNYSPSSMKCKTISGKEYEIIDKNQIDALLRSNSIRECNTILDIVYVEYSETRHYNDWIHMNDIIMNLSEKGENEDELRKKFHVPKQYNNSIPAHL